MRATPAVFGLFCALGAGPASAAQPYDGVWGDASRSCRDETYRLVAQGNRFDWYETHCKARRLSGSGSAWRFEMSCSGEGERFRTVTRVSMPSPDRLVLENAPVGPTAANQTYKRCPIPEP